MLTSSRIAAFHEAGVADAIAALANVLDIGSRKHPHQEWRLLSDRQLFDHARDHFDHAERLDAETGEPELINAIARLTMIGQRWIEERGRQQFVAHLATEDDGNG